MHWWQAVIFGIVEGLTEFLPVSSTGHLILTARCLSLEQTEFMKSFEIAIQLGAILAVIALYWKSLFVRPAHMIRVALAFVPTAIIGLILYKWIKQYLLSNDQIVLWSLFVGGLLLIIFDLVHKEKEGSHTKLEDVSFAKAIGVGVIQALSVIPGVSRAGATIIGGLALGFNRKTIVEFSFLLAVPTILAATAFDLMKSGGAFASSDWGLIGIGTITSFIVAILAIRFFIGFVQRFGLLWFGVYRVFAALIFWIFVK